MRVLAIFACCCVLAQTPAKPTFEVASVKPNRDHSRGFIGEVPAGHGLFRGFTATDARLHVLLMLAYGISSDKQLAGAPSWLDTDGFDIEAKTEHPTSPEEIGLMLQSLLEDRFKLQVRRETKEESGYALVMQNDAPNPLLQPSAEGTAPSLSGGGSPGGPTKIILRNVPMSRLAWMMSGPEQAGRPVVDKTGLKGGYDFELEFSRISGSKPGQEPVEQESSGPSLVAALRKLGLKLVPQKVSVDFITIEHVEKPSAN